jgi:hypothetical protein
MAETEWLTEIDPLMLIPHLRRAKGIHRTRAGFRRLRLFGCNCCRRVWRLFEPEERCAKLVEMAERLADGAVGADAIEPLLTGSALRGEYGLSPCREAAARYVVSSDIGQASERAAMMAADLAAYALSPPSTDEHVRVVMAERRQQVLLVHEMFGNPFRPITLAPAERTPIIVSLARAAYDERHLPSNELDPHRLAVLADALEEVGAPDELVAHLRSTGPHVRGCWAVDLCLGLS